MPKAGEIRKWDPKALARAIYSVRDEEMGIFRASKIYGVPHTTLQRHARSNKSIAELFSLKCGTLNTQILKSGHHACSAKWFGLMKIVSPKKNAIFLCSSCTEVFCE